ncbi:DUF4198 domain-containing protein [Reichenbachiella agarivorans]|uniref:DUF4198 domain-containing protein n=1 Tax=Reichenbachiella agarivorans TaxID=2979464 RepID=A0ABY6CP88_9BACT|nr:DUF4198 domain-containing protein [Reichenbachiella agarivorans]UXP32342.1 DUF4198 domain-containing protein [Reichenbachiella agarivorans]
MRKIITSIAILLAVTSSSMAHYMWVETSSAGSINQAQDIRVYFGEYTYGLEEKVGDEAFTKVQDFSLWVVSPSGKKTTLKTKEQETYYLASFVPKENGTYTVILDNNNIGVIDYTQYDFGIFKTHYHSVAQIQVGETSGETIAQNEEGITVKRLAADGKEVKLQVLYKNAPLAKNELQVFVADQWSKTLHTDENGMVSFDRPWETKYIIETTKKEEVPGQYKGKDYQFIWHCATVCILP